MLRIKSHWAGIAFGSLLFLTIPLSAAEFIFINGDGPNEGLNDPTVVAAVGGNTATTLGGQRLAALKRVGGIWGSFLVSAVPIRVHVKFDVLAAGTLAGASAISLQENFLKAPKPNCWYPIALANSIAGKDLEVNVDDIEVTANSNGTFYYGLDSASPGDLSNFVDVLLHELGHGLGFISFSDLTTGAFYSNHFDIFTSFIFDEQFNMPWTSLTSAQRIRSATNEPYLVWNAPYNNAGLQSKLIKQSGPFGFRLTIKSGTSTPVLTNFQTVWFRPPDTFIHDQRPFGPLKYQSSIASGSARCLHRTDKCFDGGRKSRHHPSWNL